MGVQIGGIGGVTGGGGSIYPPFTPPVNADFSWFNQGTATLNTSVQNQVSMLLPVEAAAARYRVKTAPTVPYSITAWFVVSSGPAADANFGLGFKQSSDDKNHVLVVGSVIASQKRNGAVFDSNYIFTAVGPGVAFVGVPVCLKISDDNVNRILRYSLDGNNFVTFDTQLRTNFLTADQVLWWGGSGPSFNGAVTLLSWQES